MQSLLGSALNGLSAAHRATVTGSSFFSSLIAAPFHHGLMIVFTFALIMCLIAAAASWAAGAASDRSPAMVTISASFGAGGTPIGKAVVRCLRVPFMDRAIPRKWPTVSAFRPVTPRRTTSRYKVR